MDFVTGWKLASIVLTGGFGILGLLKDFKDKGTGTITKWGGISLAGIVLSTCLGVAAQLRESSEQETARNATAKQTLALVQNTSQAVQDMQRLLSPFSEPRFSFTWEIPCDSPNYREFCSTQHDRNGVRVDSPNWRRWPVPDEWPSRENPRLLALSINLFLDAKRADGFLSHGSDNRDYSPNLSFDVMCQAQDENDRKERVLLVGSTNGENELLFVHRTAPAAWKSDDTIKSKLDLRGTTIIVVLRGWEAANDLTLKSFVIHLKNGEDIVTDRNLWQKIAVQEPTFVMTGARYEVP